MFEQAFEKLIRFEGGYVNDPDDTGGETYKGISRNNFPNWNGWVRIDAHKDSANSVALFKADFELQSAVESFYKENFWDRLKCDLYPDSIAEELFELSVNTGIKRATKILQETINLLNRDEKLYRDIKVDGSFGDQTLSSFKMCLGTNKEKLIFNLLNILQGAFYVGLMQKNKVYEKYIGWFNRVEIYKSVRG